MTPVALLVAFCATMAAIAAWRLAVEADPDRVELGATLAVVGITLLTALWVALEEGLLSAGGRALLTLAGLGVAGAGVTMMVRCWDDRPERDTAGD